MEISMKIQNDSEYEAALKRAEDIFFASPSTPLGDELNALVDAIEEYEDVHFPIAPQEQLRLLSNSKPVATVGSPCVRRESCSKPASPKKRPASA